MRSNPHVMFDGQFRKQVDATVRPIGRGLARAGVTPDVITGIGLAMSLAAAVSIGAGAFSLGLLLVVLTAIPDLLDGAVAKASGRSSVRGAFFDSVSDRITDAMLFAGLTYFFAASGEPAWVVMLPVAGYATRILGVLSSGQGRCPRVRRPCGVGRAGRTDHVAGGRTPLRRARPGRNPHRHRGPEPRDSRTAFRCGVVPGHRRHAHVCRHAVTSVQSVVVVAIRVCTRSTAERRAERSERRRRATSRRNG